MRIPQCAPLSPIGRIPLCTASRSPQCAPLRAQYIRTSQCQCAPLCACAPSSSQCTPFCAPHPFSAEYAPPCAPSRSQCASLGASHPLVHTAHSIMRTPLAHNAHPSVHRPGHNAHTPLCIVQATVRTSLCTAPTPFPWSTMRTPLCTVNKSRSDRYKEGFALCTKGVLKRAQCTVLTTHEFLEIKGKPPPLYRSM